MSEMVTFYCDEQKLEGEIWIPDTWQPGQKLPAWIFGTGIASLYHTGGSIPDQCRRLSTKGYVCLAFNYRGFGKSEGNPLVDPWRQVKDWRSAITFLQTRSEVDEARIGIFGRSYGAAVVSVVAAMDDRVSACVSFDPFANGERWLKGMRSVREWADFLSLLEEDRCRRAIEGTSMLVSLFEIMPTSGADRKFKEARINAGESIGKILLESAELTIRFRPEDYVSKIRCPILYTHPSSDTIVPATETQYLYDLTQAPKTLWIMPTKHLRDASHFRKFEGVGSNSTETSWYYLFSSLTGWMTEALPLGPSVQRSPYEADLTQGSSGKFRRESDWLRLGGY